MLTFDDTAFFFQQKTAQKKNTDIYIIPIKILLN